jgi:hypothetical protein
MCARLAHYRGWAISLDDYGGECDEEDGDTNA